MEDAARTLQVCFETAEDFLREYAANLRNGGIFVTTDESIELRERVELELSLRFCGESLGLVGEVVHRVPPEMVPAGASPGVAVQFQESIRELRERLEPLREAAGAAAVEPEEPALGRRRASREPARVAARIEASGQVLAGQTRNLSGSGVLVTVSDGSIPIGQEIDLALVHPTTGEELLVPARVMRHVATEGDVAALGIHFEAEGEDRARLTRFVEDLQGVEHTRRLGGISGPIEELGVQALLQMFGSSAPAGTLVLRRAEDEGVVGFEGGSLRCARLGAATGLEALKRLLAWSEGSFEFHARLDPADANDPPVPIDAALLECVTSLDEESRAARPPVSPDAHPRIVADFDELAGDDLSKVETAVLDLVRVGASVKRIIEVIPEPDPEVRRALEALADRGAIEIDP